MLAILAGNASYIAAPAVIRAGIPDANPGLYGALPLAITFPMNIILGVPFYIELTKLFFQTMIGRSLCAHAWAIYYASETYYALKEKHQGEAHGNNHID